MTQGSSSVVVVPQDWEGGIDELARKMMPVTRQPSAQLVPLLERGPMTIEADLSLAEAERLQERLRALGVPARIVAFGEELGPAEPAAPARPEEPRRAGPDGSAHRAGAPDALEDALELADALELEDALEIADALEEVGWGQIFEHAADWEEIDASDDTEAAPEAAGDGHVRVERDAAFGAEPAPPALVSPPRPSPQPQWDGARAPSPPTFDARQMSDALLGPERPPYAPDGFDDRVEHIPALAVLLSALAPGAGQIYNGQEDQVREICLQVALVRPWIDSVRQARERAEQIRGYWAPWPQKGALGRALKHLAICWVVAALLVSALVWAGGAIYRVASAPPVPRIAEVDVAQGVQRARAGVSQAHLAAGAAQQSEAQAQAESAPPQRFTMADGERAERLFRQGYAYCSAGRYRTCAAAMRRVSELSPELRRRAFRLQAWAEIRQSSDSDEPMPDVGEVESLSEYEMKMLPSQPE